MWSSIPDYGIPGKTMSRISTMIFVGLTRYCRVTAIWFSLEMFTCNCSMKSVHHADSSYWENVCRWFNLMTEFNWTASSSIVMCFEEFWKREGGKAGFPSRSNHFPFLRGRKESLRIQQNECRLPITSFYNVWQGKHVKSVKSVYLALPGIPCRWGLGWRGQWNIFQLRCLPGEKLVFFISRASNTWLWLVYWGPKGFLEHSADDTEQSISMEKLCLGSLGLSSCSATCQQWDFGQVMNSVHSENSLLQRPLQEPHETADAKVL